MSRIAIISDVHANRQALKATLLDIQSLGADLVFCLGDLVGYGPAPAAVVETIHEKVRHLIIGNHDAALCGALDENCFNDEALSVIRWTRNQLDPKALDFLADLPYLIEGEGYACSHSEFIHPNRFDYLDTPEKAAASMEARTEPFLFTGHTHVPYIHVADPKGRLKGAAAQNFQAKEGFRYLINVGSVGQPRDGDFRASYCLFDSKKKQLHFRKIPFDIDAYKKDLEKSRIPVKATYFIDVADKTAAPSARPKTDFKPKSGKSFKLDPAKIKTTSVREESKRARRWKTLAIILFACVLPLAVAAAFLASLLAPRQSSRFALELPPAKLVHLDRGGDVELPFTCETLPDTAAAALGEGNLLDVWSVKIQDPSSQTLRVLPPESPGDPFVLAISGDGEPADVVLVSRGVKVAAGDKIQLFAQTRKTDDGHAGSMQARLRLGKMDIPLKEYLVRDEFPDDFGPPKRPTSNALPATGELRVVLNLVNFKGQIQLKNVKLSRIPLEDGSR